MNLQINCDEFGAHDDADDKDADGYFWNESFAKMLQICKQTVVMGFKPKNGDFVKELRDGDDVFTIFADRLLKLGEFG